METSETIVVEQPVSAPVTGVTVLVPERRKKKKKYSRGLRDIQKLDRGIAKASRRVSRAVASGLSSYVKESEKSARKHRDGRIKYAFENWATALSKTIRQASSAPSILADAVSTKNTRRQFRTLVQLSVFPFSR
jgi:hypothetical protein